MAEAKYSDETEKEIRKLVKQNGKYMLLKKNILEDAEGEFCYPGRRYDHRRFYCFLKDLKNKKDNKKDNIRIIVDESIDLNEFDEKTRNLLKTFKPNELDNLIAP